MIGGLLGTVALVPLADAISVLDAGGTAVSTAAVAAVVLFAVAALYKLSGLALARRRPPDRDRSPGGRDWHETRRWRRVLEIALVAFVVALGAAQVPWGWEWAPSTVGRLPAVAVTFVGLVLLTYCWRRFGVV